MFFGAGLAAAVLACLYKLFSIKFSSPFVENC